MTQKQFAPLCSLYYYTKSLEANAKLASNILDIPELTSKYPCQGATDVLIKHIILMFKKVLDTHRKLTTQVAFVELKHYIAYTQKIEQKITWKNGKLTLHFKKWNLITKVL